MSIHSSLSGRSSSMPCVPLGRTGLRASRMGLGCGGHSRLGQSQGKPEAASVDLVREALDLGVNFIDTAEAYRTEAIVGQAIRGRAREAVILSTKKSPRRDGQLITADDLEAALHASLRRLGTDHVDIYHLHGVSAADYPHARRELVPALQRLRDAGKIRCLGITEEFHSDPGHVMLQQAVADDCWDVMMVGFNILNQSARERVLAKTQAKGIGVLGMFAVRRALHDAQKLRATVRELVARGEVDGDALEADDPLGFLVANGAAASVTDAAYRFCRDEPGVHVVLSGTGNPAHLHANARSLTGPPLPAADCARLAAAFRRVDSVSGQ
ncbi:MAG: aldo/keto reductase [Phycisphaeraceae bacterium]